MALLTPMRLEEAVALGETFGLAVAGVRPVPHGSVNSNFELSLEGGGRAFLRVCEESDSEAVAAQNRLLSHLVAGGVPTPAPVQRADGQGTIAEHHGKPAVVFPFCDGGWICQERVRAEHVAIVGDALARIHAAGMGYGDAPPTRFGGGELRARLEGLRASEQPADVAGALGLLGDRLDQLDGIAAPETTVIHGDVFRDNVLWLAGGALSAILDFESASLGHPAFDLMVAMLAWCFGEHLDRDLGHAMIGGYVARRPLPPQEIAACYDEARRAAVRFSVTRITDYELRPRGVVVYKDFRRFVSRLRAVEEIGREPFPAWLGLA